MKAIFKGDVIQFTDVLLFLILLLLECKFDG